MHRFHILTVFYLCLSVFTCGQQSLAQDKLVKLPPGPGPLDNPLKGWCPYTTAGAVTQPYSMVFLYVPWKELEPEEGRYDFAGWESRAWDTPLAKGKHIVLRVYVDYPGKSSGMPDWLIAKGVKQRPYQEEGGGLAPDYDDPRMVTAMERLVAALGRRYDQNPRVAFVEMGLLGFWGEWHTYPRTELFANPATQQRVLDAAHRAFPNKIVMTRYPSGYAGDQPWIGFFDDLFPDDTDGPEDWKFLPKMRRSGRTDNWKQAAIGGEMVPGAASRWLGEGFERTLSMVEKAHITWVGPYGPALERTQTPNFAERSSTLVRRMGYEFRLTEIRHPAQIRKGERLTVNIEGENIGVAPFYYPWPVELALLDSEGRAVKTYPVTADIRKWVPGPFRISPTPAANVPPGRYHLAIGIRDPWTGMPAIGFANTLPKKAGWTVLSEVTVAD